MKNIKEIIILFLGLFSFINNIEANVVVNNGRGLTHIRAAWVLDAGRLTFYSHTRFFGKVGQKITLENTRQAITYWNVQGLAGFRYGLGGHFELGITPIIYQDVNKGGPGNNGYNLPDDLFLAVKIGSFGRQANSLSYGVETYLRLGTAERYNVLYEPYSAGTSEVGFTGLLSYAMEPLYPEDAPSLHLNLGYLNHNDVGKKLKDGDREGVLQQSQELLYGLGVKLPAQDFDYAFELYGNIFLQQPPRTAYSRENYLYLAPSITYKPFRWLNLVVSGDFRLTQDLKGDRISGLEITGLPINYPGWRVNIGMRLTLLPISVFSVTERDVFMQKSDTRRELFEQIIQERRETESAEEELERIKEERKKAEQQLERLKKILEGQAKRREAAKELQKEYENSSKDDDDKDKK